MTAHSDDEKLRGKDNASVSTTSNNLRKTLPSDLLEDKSSSKSSLSTPSRPQVTRTDPRPAVMQPMLGAGSRSRLFKESTGNADSQFLPQPARRRLSLFETLPSRSRNQNEMTASSLHQRYSPSTILDDDFQSTLCLSNENSSSQVQEKSSTLFGAVMKRFGATLGSPIRNQMPATPTRNSEPIVKSFDNSGEGLTSPTGKSIMNFVRTFVNSPFRFQSPKATIQATDRSEVRTTPCPEEMSSPRRKRRRLDVGNDDSRSSFRENENWQEVRLDATQMKIVDYTLKTKLSIECNKESSLRSVVSREDFLELLSFWQYPAAAPIVSGSFNDYKVIQLSKSLFDEGNRDRSHLGQSNRPVPLTPKTTAKKVDRLVRGNQALLSRSSGTSIKSGFSTFGCHREWQEAFRSVYLKWWGKVEALIQEGCSRDALLDAYFYCVARDHVVVFRIEELKGRHVTKRYSPRVIVSNFTKFFRETLERMGVENIELFHEKRRGVAGESAKATTKTPSPMSPTLKADLEALRRAQAYGENTGADVFVKQQKRNSQKSATDYEKLPLCVSGPEDVSLFFEVYLNLLGSIVPPCVKQEALPTIYCRNVGPFLHASMKSLKVRPVKSRDTDSIEMEGMILPCAIRKVVGHLATVFLKGAAQQQCLEDKDEGKSGYMVIQAVTEGEDNQSCRSLKDSSRFNGWVNASRKEQPMSAGGNHECGNSKAVHLVVWDASSKNVVACNIE